MPTGRRPPSPDHHSAAVGVKPFLIAAVAMLAVTASACADPVTEPVPAPPPSAQPSDPGPDAPATDAPEADAPEADAPEADPDRAGPENRFPDDHLAGPGICITEVEGEVLDTISAQLDDLARRDFAAALSQATDAFQEGTDTAAFKALIEGSFPLLLEDASAELSSCFQRGPATVEAGVEITTGDRVSAPFVYRLRFDEDRWAVEAAARLTPPPATA